jgi:Asparagine synthase
VPTRQIYHRGIQRPILRRAAAEVLPPRIRERHGKARFTALFVQGFYEQGRSAVEHLLFRASAAWPQFLDRDWVARAWQRQDRGLGALLLWLAFSLELWLERRSPTSSGTVPLQPLTSDRAALA